MRTARIRAYSGGGRIRAYSSAAGNLEFALMYLHVLYTIASFEILLSLSGLEAQRSNTTASATDRCHYSAKVQARAFKGVAGPTSLGNQTFASIPSCRVSIAQMLAKPLSFLPLFEGFSPASPARAINNNSSRYQVRRCTRQRNLSKLARGDQAADRCFAGLPEGCIDLQ